VSITKLRPTFTFDQDRLDALKAIAPEAFADGKINWETLKETLGERLEDEGQEAEHFGLTWPGKRAARRLASQPSAGALRPAPGEGVNEETTRHVFIEGDNMEVLKLLQKSYAGRVKMIYIDPPYNTGSDFVYRDDYRQPLEEYLHATGQMDEAGRVLTTNTKSAGRYHTNWLNMMYPRLRLARQLLQDEGVIFVSIDDHELHNLWQLLNEIFGEEGLVGILVWQSKRGGGSDKAGIVTDHEYIVCFQKNGEAIALARIAVESEELDRVDDKGPYRRGRELNKWGSNSRREDRPTMYFAIPGPDGEEVFPIRNDGTEGRWRWGRKKMLDIVERSDVDFVQRPDGTYIVYEKIRLTDPRSKPYRTWLLDVGTTADGSKAVKNLFDGKKVYDFPKPVELVKRLIEMGTINDDDIVMDFFAGSCTAAQAVLEWNQENEVNIRFICVQWPEPTAPSSEARKYNFATIADIGKERIRRIIQRMQTEGQPQLIPERESPEDLGFRVFKLERSHFKAWQDYEGGDVAQLETLFDRFESPLVEGWQPGDLLVEIMLMQGFPLDSAVTPLPDCPHNHVLRVTSDLVTHKLYVCLDARLHLATAEALALRLEDIFVCLDSALDEETKLRLQDGRNVMVI
jgi:adenine-specific DNA-methyltransferase